MRTKEEIKNFYEMRYRYGSIESIIEAHTESILEVLIDIRDLLTQEKEK